MRLRLRCLLLAICLLTPCLAQTDSPTLPKATLELLREAEWQEAALLDGEWGAWSRGQARLVWSGWQPAEEGRRWRLGSEQARFSLPGDHRAMLGLERGWALEIIGVESDAMAEKEMISVATTLSTDGTVWRTVGESVQGRPIEVVSMGSGPNKTLFFGVFHGDEQAGDVVLRRLTEYLIKTPSALVGRSVLICPVLNPDGLQAGTRVNARKVDVNRNFPAANWTSEGKGTRYWGGPQAGSEPETQVAIKLIESFAPSKIVTLHATLHNVNYDGPAAALAERMSALNGYVVEPDIGYPTPGSFGTYVGRERGIPTITLEFPEGDGPAMWLENKKALLEAIRYEHKD